MRSPQESDCQLGSDAIQCPTYEVLEVTSGVDLNHWLSTFVDNLEWEVLEVPLDIIVVEGSSNHSLGVEHGVFWILGSLVLCCVTDQSFLVGESDP